MYMFLHSIISDLEAAGHAPPPSLPLLSVNFEYCRDTEITYMLHPTWTYLF